MKKINTPEARPFRDMGMKGRIAVSDVKPILGILMGDSGGVGPELVAKLAVSKFYDDYWCLCFSELLCFIKCCTTE